MIRELAQIRKEHKRELEYEKFDGYELPPRTQFSMLNKPAVSIKYGVMKFNMACIRLFEGIKYVLPILHPNKKRLALIMCPEEDSASVEWARRKDENWVNKDITSLEFVENIFRLMNWNRECRYKVLGRVANSDQGLCMLFDLEEAIMFTPKPQEYTDPLTGEMKKKQMKFFPDAYKNRIGKSYNDYIADHQMNMFEDFIPFYKFLLHRHQKIIQFTLNFISAWNCTNHGIFYDLAGFHHITNCNGKMHSKNTA